MAASGVTTRPTHCEAEQGGAWPVEGDPVAAAGCCPQDGLGLARLAPEARAAGRCHRPRRRHCRWPSARRAYRSESSALSPGSGPRPCRPGGTSVAGGGRVGLSSLVASSFPPGVAEVHPSGGEEKTWARLSPGQRTGLPVEHPFRRREAISQRRGTQLHEPAEEANIHVSIRASALLGDATQDVFDPLDR